MAFLFLLPVIAGVLVSLYLCWSDDDDEDGGEE